MTLDTFFGLFLKELEVNRQLWSYYKFHTDPASFAFRKAYFCQRLQYVLDHAGDVNNEILDIGCGYGTTAIFLALNGYKVHGTTLEFYYKEIPERLRYWSGFGNVSGFTFDYEDLFDPSLPRKKYERIIVQDTLHHLEPLPEAIGIIERHLGVNGQIIVIEENGNNLIQSLKLYRQRGNKRIIEFYDERLKKTILLGNENIRSLKTWMREFSRSGLVVDPASVQYVRALPPSVFNRLGYEKALQYENNLWRRNPLLKEYFFFGINFMVSRSGSGKKADKIYDVSHSTLS